MTSLKIALKKRLEPAQRIALLGIGSELRGDDACGILVAESLKRYSREIPGSRKFKVFIGGTAPENLTGEIKKFNPTHVILIDAADIGKKAGMIKLISPEEAKGISFCTHQLPLKIMADYLVQSIGCAMFIIGIQPKKIDFGASVSRQVQAAVRTVSAALKGAMGSIQTKNKKGAGKRC